VAQIVAVTAAQVIRVEFAVLNEAADVIKVGRLSACRTYTFFMHVIRSRHGYGKCNLKAESALSKLHPSQRACVDREISAAIALVVKRKVPKGD
jgi:hypothetical protein